MKTGARVYRKNPRPSMAQRRAAADAHPILQDPLTTYQIVSLLAWIRTVPAGSTETTFLNKVVKAAESIGLLVYHTHTSEGSQRGFPDLVIVGWGRIAFWELKTETGREEPEQTLWLWALQRIAVLTCGLVQVRTYRPRDFTLDGPIVQGLIKLARPPRKGGGGGHHPRPENHPSGT